VRKDERYLEDIIEAIDAIGKYSIRGEEAFRTEDLIQVWIVHHIQTIGEACRSLSTGLRDRHTEVPWHNIISMRNILVHHYFGIDKDAVWQVVTDHLPVLKHQIEDILHEITSSSDDAA
jgi:uncharacterized protein with HEPN domain